MSGTTNLMPPLGCSNENSMHKRNGFISDGGGVIVVRKHVKYTTYRFPSETPLYSITDYCSVLCVLVTSVMYATQVYQYSPTLILSGRVKDVTLNDEARLLWHLHCDLSVTILRVYRVHDVEVRLLEVVDVHA